MMSDPRLQREAEFHDQSFSGNTRARAGKFYLAAAAAKRHYHTLVEESCIGKRVLEYGCGKGSQAFTLAGLGADVVGVAFPPRAFVKQLPERGRRVWKTT